MSKTKSKKQKRPYKERTDLQKLRAQWTKMSGLHEREEPSAAVVRAATAAEVAVNIAIRREFKARSKFDAEFIGSVLTWANGIKGKMDRLLVPITEKRKYASVITGLRQPMEVLNKKRNDIIHRGEFCNRTEALAVIETARQFIVTLMRVYNKRFALRAPRKSSS